MEQEIKYEINKVNNFNFIFNDLYFKYFWLNKMKFNLYNLQNKIE